MKKNKKPTIKININSKIFESKNELKNFLLDNGIIWKCKLCTSCESACFLQTYSRIDNVKGKYICYRRGCQKIIFLRKSLPITKYAQIVYLYMSVALNNQLYFWQSLSDNTINIIRNTLWRFGWNYINDRPIFFGWYGKYHWSGRNSIMLKKNSKKPDCIIWCCGWYGLIIGTIDDEKKLFAQSRK